MKENKLKELKAKQTHRTILKYYASTVSSRMETKGGNIGEKT